MNMPSGVLRADTEARPYRVRIAPLPTVVDGDDRTIDHAQVLEILFPGETIETPSGPRNIIVGAGVAKILVGDITIRGVPLC